MLIQIIDEDTKEKTVVRGDASYTQGNTTQGKLYVEGAVEDSGEHYFHIFEAVMLTRLSSGYADGISVDLLALLPPRSGTGEGPKFYRIIIS